LTIILEKIAGAFFNPKGITHYEKDSNLVTNIVFSRYYSAIGT